MDITIRAAYQQSPLLAFSPTTHLQVDCLRQVASDFSSALSASIAGSNVDASLFQRAYGLFWLWTLGAYEITRTLREISEANGLAIGPRIRSYEKQIKALRIPMAKLKAAGKDKWAWQDAMPTGFSAGGADLTFLVSGKNVSAAALITGFESNVANISFEEVRPLLGP